MNGKVWRPWLLGLACACMACGAPKISGDDGNTTTAASSTGESSSGGESGDASTSTSTGTSETETETGDTGTSDTADFLPPENDLPPTSCSIYEQDCTEGEKCVPSGPGLDPHCAMIIGDAGLGQPCTADGQNDSCEYGLFCFVGMNMDPSEAFCAPLCTGTPNAPMCPDLSMECIGVGLCLGAVCNPLEPEPCDGGWPCLGRVGMGGARCSFVEGADYGVLGLGEVCAASTDCAQGLACTAGPAVPGCMGQDCCTAWCDPMDPQACVAQMGTVCQTGMNGTYGRCVTPP